MTKPGASSLRCVFRVAAGPRVGFGHLMRARSLAEALGVRPSVSVRGGHTAKRAARSLGCRVVDGAQALRGAHLLVVDDPSWVHGRVWAAHARRLGVRCVSVHDGGSKLPGVELTVDGSIYLGPSPARAASLEGARFYILDRRVQAARRVRGAASRRAHPRILVALGGGQHVRGIARRMVAALASRCPEASVAVASGFAAGAPTPLPHGEWLAAPNGLIEPLTTCDVAVVAGGVTLYEACALGVPAVGLAVVPEQRQAIRSFARHGAVLDAGGPAGSAIAIARAAARIAQLLHNDRLRHETTRRARGLVDGRGASRVARRVLAMLADGRRGRA